MYRIIEDMNVTLNNDEQVIFRNMWFLQKKIVVDIDILLTKP